MLTLLLAVLFVAILAYRGFLRWVEYKENRHVLVNRAAVELMGHDTFDPPPPEERRWTKGQNFPKDDDGWIVNEEGSNAR